MDSINYYKSIMNDAEDFNKLKVFNSVKELFINTCLLYKNNKAIIWNSGEVTYFGLLQDSLQLSCFLQSRFKKGDHIGLFFANEYDFVKTFFACSILGLVCAIIPSSIPQDKLINFTHLFNLKSFITNKDITCEGVNCINISTLELSDKYWSVDEALNYVFISKKDPACIVFTGGTTGMPKGALLSQINLCRGAFNGALTKGKIFKIKYLSLIPFSHIFGLVKNLLSCILTGSELYIVTNPALFAKEAVMYQPETFVLTPGLCSIVLTLLKNYGKNFFGSRFNNIIAGGAHVPANLIHSFKEIGIDCLPGYGLTEAANLVSGNGSIETKDHSVGVPYPGQELKIVNNELWIKGDNVFLGYYNNPVATANVLQDGWLKTGDLASFDEDGFLYIHGRINNLIVLQSGLKVCPEDIENIIDRNSLVRDSIVRKESETDSLYAEVLLFDNSKTNQDEVQKYILNVVNCELDSSSKINRVVFRMNDFKRTPAMKIIR